MVLILEIKHLFGVGTTFIYKNDASYHNNVKMSEIANKVGLSERKAKELIYTEFKEQSR